MCYQAQIFHPSAFRRLSSLYFIKTKRERSIVTRTDTTVNNAQAVVWESAPQTKEEAMMRLLQSPRLYKTYQGIKSEKWKTRILDFFAGNRSLPLTYDPFFKFIFNPDRHADRLERFISSILGMRVKIKKILPIEDSLMDGETYLIMDLLVELEDGSLANIEIQKNGYAFTEERLSCYAADLLMRQYTRVRGERGTDFTYRDIKKVYVIVLYEKSMAEFHRHGDAYFHHGKINYDTGLNLEMLDEYFLIALDVFTKIPYAEDNKGNLHAWLSLLTTEDLADAERNIEHYPWLAPVYEEIALLRRSPEEVIGMWSEALRILDENSLKYYVEELKEELDKEKSRVQEMSQAYDAVLSEKNIALNEKDEALRVLREKDAEIAVLKEQLESK